MQSYKMMRIIRKTKNALIYIIELFRLPHIITTVLLIIIAIVIILISTYLRSKSPFISSILSNVFAGLVTGIAICLINGTKNIFLYKNRGTIAFLNEVHETCLAFLREYKRIINESPKQDLPYEELYNLLCLGNEIDFMISQSQFNKTLSFNPYRFFSKKLKYDAVEQMKKNHEIREKLISMNANSINSKEYTDLFSEMAGNIFLLNGKVLSKIKEHEIRQNISGKSII